MLITVRIFFFAAFVGISAADAQNSASPATMGLAAAIVAAAAVVAESMMTRHYARWLAPAVFGALYGWLAGCLLLWAAQALPLARMTIEPPFEAALLLGTMYLGALAAIRGCGRWEILRITKKSNSQNTPRGLGWWFRGMLAAFIVGLLLLNAGRLSAAEPGILAGRLAPLALAGGALALDLIFSRKLPSALAVLAPAVLFAAAGSAQSYTIGVLAGGMSRWLAFEAQQAAWFVLWLYFGLAFLLRARQAGTWRVPLIAFEETKTDRKES